LLAESQLMGCLCSVLCRISCHHLCCGLFWRRQDRRV